MSSLPLVGSGSAGIGEPARPGKSRLTPMPSAAGAVRFSFGRPWSRDPPRACTLLAARGCRASPGASCFRSAPAAYRRPWSRLRAVVSGHGFPALKQEGPGQIAPTGALYRELVGNATTCTGCRSGSPRPPSCLGTPGSARASAKKEPRSPATNQAAGFNWRRPSAWSHGHGWILPLGGLAC